ncbi:methyltransferase [Streptomyces sp. NL15-2K]|uniref:methyltransferase n=1 Tax=Streptomyces sp. NL15-2K TaxID=376149 RepID=UPI000F565904|nr:MULTISPECIES: methyltransferase [Actinomycetes]WKX13933.1 methyltransferase [Kutzneria buriramensis]GCB50879.1 O-methyltransferase [Streptomyces sp. NL15-2K]
MSTDVTPTASRTTLGLITAAWHTQSVYAAVALGLPDLVAAGHTGVQALARAAGADEDGVRRLLRLLVRLGVFEESEDGGYRNTEVGDLLRDRPGSLRDVCLLYGKEFYQAWGHASETFRTGRPGFEEAYGQSLISYLRDDADAAKRFQRAMQAQASNFSFDAVPKEIDFAADRHVVDIAGGSGQLLASVLNAAPGARGTLLDLEHALPIARAHLERAVGDDRAALVAGDMFTSPFPKDADTYLLSRVLGDWPDDDCVRLLRKVRESMAEHSRLLVIELVVQDGGDGLLAPLWDLHLLVVNGGRQRTLGEYRELAARSGLSIERLVPLPMEATALVLTPEG